MNIYDIIGHNGLFNYILLLLLLLFTCFSYLCMLSYLTLLVVLALSNFYYFFIYIQMEGFSIQHIKKREDNRNFKD